MITFPRLALTMLPAVLLCQQYFTPDDLSSLHAAEANYDESKVPEYTLPDALLTHNGQKVTTPEQWWKIRRPEILEMFTTQMYGKVPEQLPRMKFRVLESEQGVLGGLADRKQVKVQFGDQENGPNMDILIYLPADRSAPAPLFLGLNFQGNHSITDDPAIRLSDRWMRARDDGSVADNRATEQARGAASSRWPLDLILGRGYGLATIYYGDIDPDFDDGFKNGVHPLLLENEQSQPDEAGSIAAWAWGLSRALDYLEQDPNVDADRVAVVGHSRLGKTSLWAGASDRRFAVVISNDSGCGGAALSRRQFGETVQRINTSFPHWFADNFTKYNNREDQCPFDQHMLIALIAPRPVLICSAEDDRWADPRGEFLSAKHADVVYDLLGYRGIKATEMPPLNELTGHRIGYHIRPGRHDMKRQDWEVYLKFREKHGR